METNNMIYQINDRPPFKKLLLFSLQMMLSVFVATVLIANICGVNVSAALVGAGLSTIVYGILTGRQSPMFISNSGAFVAPVLFALGLAGYTGVAIGGAISAIVYCLFGLIFSKVSVDAFYKIFPRTIIGSVTMVIGLALMGFIPTYVQVNGEANQIGMLVALFTMLVVALTSHYAKGIAKILPFLIGTIAGYAVSAILTLTGVCPLIDFSAFNNIGLFCMPEFAFTKWSAIPMSSILSIAVLYIAYTISASMEIASDHLALSGIIGTYLIQTVGLGKIFTGVGIGNLVGSCVGGLGQCSYGEGVSCVGFSKVASRSVVTGAAIILALLGFISPVQAFINSIPSAVFGGEAMILYGFIALSGAKQIQKVNLDNQKNLILVSVILSVGVSGVVLGGASFAFSGTALALIVGVILNLILKENNKEGN